MAIPTQETEYPPFKPNASPKKKPIPTQETEHPPDKGIELVPRGQKESHKAKDEPRTEPEPESGGDSGDESGGGIEVSPLPGSSQSKLKPLKRRDNSYRYEGFRWKARYRAPRFSRNGNAYASYSTGVSPDLVFIAGIGLVIAANSKNGIIRDVYRLVAGGNIGVNVSADFKVLGAELLFIFILSLIAKTSPDASNVMFAFVVGLWMVWAIVNADSVANFSKFITSNLQTVQDNQKKQSQDKKSTDTKKEK